MPATRSKPFNQRISWQVLFLRTLIISTGTCIANLVSANEASTAAESDHEVVGWSSPHDMTMMEWAGPVMADLLTPVVEVATQATEFSERAPALIGSHPRWRVVETWANVQRKGGSNATHPHPGTFWSGVYYVDAGDITADGRHGGALQAIPICLAAAIDTINTHDELATAAATTATPS